MLYVIHSVCKVSPSRVVQKHVWLRDTLWSSVLCTYKHFEVVCHHAALEALKHSKAKATKIQNQQSTE